MRLRRLRFYFHLLQLALMQELDACDFATLQQRLQQYEHHEQLCEQLNCTAQAYDEALNKLR